MGVAASDRGSVAPKGLTALCRFCYGLCMMGRGRQYAWGAMTTAEWVGTLIGWILVWGTLLVGVPYVIWWLATT